MPAPDPEPANPLSTDRMPWIPTSQGKSFRPLRFEPGGWSELMRLEPGAIVPLHRHTGELHAYNLSGAREILGSGELVGPGDYVYEPGGMVDSWRAVGDEPCVILIKAVGSVEYLDESGAVLDTADSRSQQAAYLTWCHEHGVQPAEGVTLIS